VRDRQSEFGAKPTNDLTEHDPQLARRVRDCRMSPIRATDHGCRSLHITGKLLSFPVDFVAVSGDRYKWVALSTRD
jgi:hypothetical protein